MSRIPVCRFSIQTGGAEQVSSDAPIISAAASLRVD